MKVQVWYQDFTFNVLRQFGHSIAFDIPKALRVWERDIISPTNRDELLDKTYAVMNHWDIPEGDPDRSLFRRIGHTSMSIGDFIVFENEPTVIYLCSGAECGWQREETGQNVFELKGVPDKTHAEAWWDSLGNKIPDLFSREYGQMWLGWAECFRQRNQL